MVTLYRLFAKDGTLIYVGISKHIGRRLAQHAAGKSWFPDVASVTFEQCATLAEARSREAEAIAGEQPAKNLRGLLQLVKVSVVLTEHQHASLSAFAKAEGRSMAYLVREAVNEWIERRTKKGAA